MYRENFSCGVIAASDPVVRPYPFWNRHHFLRIKREVREEGVVHARNGNSRLWLLRIKKRKCQSVPGCRCADYFSTWKPYILGISLNPLTFLRPSKGNDNEDGITMQIPIESFVSSFFYTPLSWFRRPLEEWRGIQKLIPALLPLQMS